MRTLKFVVLGDSGVGKTSLVQQLVNRKFDAIHRPTLGCECYEWSIAVGEGECSAVSVQLWDTAGQERFLALGTTYYRGADACILVFDITSRASFDSVTSWLDEFYLHTDQRCCVLIGNKSDLREAREVEARAAHDWCSVQNSDPSVRGSRPIRFFEVTAAEHDEISKAVQSLVLDVLPPKLSHANAPLEPTADTALTVRFSPVTQPRTEEINLRRAPSSRNAEHTESACVCS